MDGEIVLTLARDWPRGRKYEDELEAAMTGCREEYSRMDLSLQLSECAS